MAPFYEAVRIYLQDVFFVGFFVVIFRKTRANTPELSKKVFFGFFCLAAIFTECFTCRAHIENTDLAEIGARFQGRHHSFAIVRNNLKSSSVHYVHLLAHFT